MTIFLALGASVESVVSYYDSCHVSFVKQNIFVSYVGVIQISQEGLNRRLAFLWSANLCSLYCK